MQARELVVDDPDLAVVHEVLGEEVVVAGHRCRRVRLDGLLDPTDRRKVVLVPVRHPQVVPPADLEKPVELAKDVEVVHERSRAVVQPTAGAADARDVRRAADVLEVKRRAVDVLEHERGELRKRRR